MLKVNQEISDFRNKSKIKSLKKNCSIYKSFEKVYSLANSKKKVLTEVIVKKIKFE